MIRIILGQIGSGKTARIVKEIVTNNTNRMYFSNIKTKGTKNNTVIADCNIKDYLKYYCEEDIENYLSDPDNYTGKFPENIIKQVLF